MLLNFVAVGAEGLIGSSVSRLFVVVVSCFVRFVYVFVFIRFKLSTDIRKPKVTFTLFSRIKIV